MQTLGNLVCFYGKIARDGYLFSEKLLKITPEHGYGSWAAGSTSLTKSKSESPLPQDNLQKKWIFNVNLYYNAQFWSDFKTYFLSHFVTMLSGPSTCHKSNLYYRGLGEIRWIWMSKWNLKEVFYNLREKTLHIRSLFGVLNLPVIVHVTTLY